MVQIAYQGNYGNGNHKIPEDIPQFYFYSVHFVLVFLLIVPYEISQNTGLATHIFIRCRKMDIIG